MMAAVEIRRALSALLKQHFPYAVYFTNNASADKGYFHVELAPKKHVVDRVIYEREIDVMMELVLPPDARGRIDRAKLYEAVDTLDAALMPVLTIGDRHITVQETSSRIVDEVLHYSFSFDFADAMPEEPVELMEELFINGEREIEEEEWHMPNEAEKFGLPQVIIDFRTKSTTAIARSARGIGVMILNNETTNVSKFYKISDSTDIPDEGLTEKNVALIKKALLGVPLRILVYTLPTTDVVPGEGTLLNQADVLKKLHNIKWNYICHPTGTAQDQEDLATWVKKERNIKRKTFKAVVANFDADDKGVINFTTDNIRCVNPAYTDALQAANGDKTKVKSSTPEYLVYTSTEYTARIMGILAGLALDRSATYYELGEVHDCEVYEDIDDCISKGQLCLFDEMDGNGVKIARACNSLHTFTTDVGQDFRYIKIIEAVDMITDDIRDTFKNSYVGKVINDYNHDSPV